MNEAILLAILLLAPLVGGGLALWLKRPEVSAIAGVLLSIMALGLLIYKQNTSWSYTWEWIPQVSFTLGFDRMTLGLWGVVAWVSLLVLIFSSKYIQEGKPRYFALLGLFISSMMGLLAADHLVLLFVFWEWVGLTSYLLIGFWYKKREAATSAQLAFMVNRAADVLLLSAIILLFTSNRSLGLLNGTDGWPVLPACLLILGAFGKSAQLPFSGWLLKAMAGPTPVSALIHAATMVAAGVYLLVRVSPALPPEAMHFMVGVGSVTALYAAVCAFVQHDIKRVLAFSTLSQLGLMVAGIGAGAAEASFFHLVTHAFFKAGLFLSAAAVIHFMSQKDVPDPQNMQYMGGLRKDLPMVFMAFLVCGAALVGLPFFSGFMSKEALLLGIWRYAGLMEGWGVGVAIVSLLTTFLTALYTARMILLVFWGAPFAPSDVTEVRSMSKRFVGPLMLLAVCSTWIVFSFHPLSHTSWLLQVTPFSHMPEANVWITLLSIAIVMSGLWVAYFRFRPTGTYVSEYRSQRETTLQIHYLLSGMGLVRLYEWLGHRFVALGKGIKALDQRGIDGFLHFLSISVVVGTKVLSLIDRFLVDGLVNLFAYLWGQMGRVFAGLSARNGQKQLIWLFLLVILIVFGILTF